MPDTPIIRVFRATVKPGKEEEFTDFFLKEAVPLIKNQLGLLSIQVGLPRIERPREFMMVTTWRDLDALRAFAGQGWNQAVIDPRERPLLSQTSVEHYGDAGI